MRTPRLAVLPVLAACVLLAGCGSLEVPYRGPRVVPAPEITTAQVARYPAGSPERTLLVAFQRVRAKQYRAAALTFTKKARSGRTRLALLLRLGAARKFVEANSSFRILDVIRHGKVATVFSEGAVRYESPNGRLDGLVPLPQAYTLVLDHGAWRFPDDSWTRSADALSLVRDPRQAVVEHVPQLVSRAEIDHEQAGTAMRAALEFLRTLQYGDPTGVRQYLTSAWKRTTIEAGAPFNILRAAAWNVHRPIHASAAGPDTEFLRIQFTKKVPLVARLKRVGGDWKLARVRLGSLVEPK